MRKTIFILSILMLLSTCGCGNKFELKADTITLELGESLSDDLSEYVIAKNYSDITVDTSDLPTSPVPSNNANSNSSGLRSFGYVYFNKPGKDLLTMKVEYVDTTPPTIESDDIYIYNISPQQWGVNNSFEYLDEPLHSLINHKYTEINKVTIRDICKAQDNYSVHIECTDIIFKDDSLTKSEGSYSLPEGDYVLAFTLSDIHHNSASYNVHLHVIQDVSPEVRELLKECGYTDADIDEYISSDKILKVE